MAKMAAASAFPKPSRAQLIPTAIPIIPQIDDAITTPLPSKINRGLPILVRPIVSSRIVPKADKIHAIMMKVRAIINFKHCPSNSSGIPEHVKTLAEHNLFSGSVVDSKQPCHKPTVTDTLFSSPLPLEIYG